VQRQKRYIYSSIASAIEHHQPQPQITCPRSVSRFPTPRSSMGLKLYGSIVTTCTQRVLVVAKHIGVPLEVVPVGLATAEHKSPEFLKAQPFGRVPYLVRLD